MKRMRMAMVVALIGAGVLSGGCLGRAVKEGFGAATGAKGVYAQTQAPAVDLRMYENIEVGAITDGFSGKTPHQLLAILPTKIVEQLQSKKLPTGASGKTLVIQGKIIYYEKAGITGQAFGPFEEVVSEIQLVDKDSGTVVAVANCIGRSTTTMNQGVKKKAEGLAKGIVKWIRKLYPKQE